MFPHLEHDKGMEPETTATEGPALPSDWVPPTCLQKDDYWIWDFGSKNDRRTVVGGPPQTSSCFPSIWEPTVTYQGNQCPPQYTQACARTTSGTIVTCCPTIYDFSCIEGNPGLDPNTRNHEAYFRCVSQYDGPGANTIVWTSMLEPNSPTFTTTRAQKTDWHLYALAVLYQTPTSTSGVPASDTSLASESLDGISTPAKAGIGAGVAVSVLIIASAVLWMFWRRKKMTSQHPPEPPVVMQQPPQPVQQPYHYATPDSSTAINTSSTPTNVPHAVVPGYHEMEVDPNQRVELPIH